MSPSFTREEQQRFFNALPKRRGYAIWGISLSDFGVIGATGLKNHRGTLAEYWGYIGERQHWGKGLGRCLIAAVETKAREMGFADLDLKVSSSNTRAITLYEKMGFVADMPESTNEYLYMIKRDI